MNKFWTTKDGDRIAYKDLSDNHLLNIIKHVQKRIEIVRGLIDDPPLDDEDNITIYGHGDLDSRMDRMGDTLLSLLKEAKSRGLHIS